MKATGGTWDPTDRHVYFLASNPEQLDRVKMHPWKLVAVNELPVDNVGDVLEPLLDQGNRVLLDSGIFWLTNAHMRANGITMNEALALPPDEIDGFDALWDRYVRVASEYGDRCWGYIELDQGGRDCKRETRARLEALGLSPMPVYHPLNDGWDYFDELAQGYDRMCMGNIVQAAAPLRTRLLHTMWERHRAYPDLWVHVLGLTPYEMNLGHPTDSADSSSWLTSIRWSAAWRHPSMLKRFASMPLDIRYVLGGTDDPTRTHGAALQLAAATEHFEMENWRAALAELHDTLGTTAYPEPDERTTLR